MSDYQRTVNYSAIVIGGGPCGSSAATILRRKGYSVLLLDRQRFPHFHIGESLLPYMTAQLERMDLLSRIEQSNFVLKKGAEFTGADGSFKRIDFTAQGPGRKQYSYQVERSRFDNLLLQQAKDAGVEVLEERAVTRLLFEGERLIGVEYTYQGEVKTALAHFVVDASGRAGKVANHLKLRKPNPHLKQVAIYRHFENLDEANNPGVYGDIQIGHHPDGWVWAIPVRDDTISVGTVTKAEIVKQAATLEEVYDTQRARIPRIVQRLKGTTPKTEIRAETDFSYLSDKLTGPGYVIAGDAGCFVDPIFSAGVYLAIITGIKAAETIDAILSGQEAEDQALTHYSNFYKTGYDCYYRLIYAFYESEHDFAKYLDSAMDKIVPRHIPRAIGGDFWNPYNTVTRHLRSERRWDTFEPFEIAYGCPVYPELEAQEGEAPQQEQLALGEQEYLATFLSQG